MRFLGIGDSNDLLALYLQLDRQGHEVFLREIWPSSEEVFDALRLSTDPETYRRLYADFATGNPLWNEIPAATAERELAGRPDRPPAGPGPRPGPRSG